MRKLCLTAALVIFLPACQSTTSNKLYAGVASASAVLADADAQLKAICPLALMTVDALAGRTISIHHATVYNQLLAASSVACSNPTGDPISLAFTLIAAYGAAQRAGVAVRATTVAK